MEWAQEGLQEGLSGDLDSDPGMKRIIRLSGPAYTEMQKFLEDFGAIHIQLDGVMKRLEHPSGRTEWVSVEGEAAWNEMHNGEKTADPEQPPPHVQPVSAQRVAVPVEAVGMLPPPPNPGLPNETSMVSWVRGYLMEHMHLDETKAGICERLLLDNDITTTKALGSLTADKMAKVISSARPELSVGMTTNMELLYAAAQELVKSETVSYAAGNSDVASASELALLKAQLEAQALALAAHSVENERTKRELEAMRKKTAGLKASQQQGGGGGQGGLMQMSANASAEANAEALRGAAVEDMLRHPEIIQMRTQVHHLAAAQPAAEQQRAAAHAKGKAELFGRGSSK